MMQQDPKKGAKDYEKPSVKQKLAQSSAKKKVGVGEMGKPDFKAGFEAAMQKERDFVLNRAKERDKYPDWYVREAVNSSASIAKKNAVVKELNKKLSSKLKSMSKNKLKY
jgi:hypothetical protein